MNSYIARHPRIACNPRRTVDAAYLGEISMLATPRVGCPFQNLSLRKKGRIGFNSRDLRERYLRFIVSSFHHIPRPTRRSRRQSTHTVLSIDQAGEQLGSQRTCLHNHISGRYLPTRSWLQVKYCFLSSLVRMSLCTKQRYISAALRAILMPLRDKIISLCIPP